MHRLPSRSIVLRFRLVSLLLWGAWLTLPGGMILTGYGMFHAEDHHVLKGACIMAGGMLSYVLVWFLSSRAKCPLCMAPPLHPKGCQKNRRARRLFGSYRLHVAASIICLNRFQCPYCGELTRVTVRHRPGARQD